MSNQDERRRLGITNPKFDIRDANISPDVSGWAALARGKTLGKSVNLEFSAPTTAGPAQSSFLDILQVSTDDSNAHQLNVVLTPPRIYSGLVGPVVDLAALSGSQDSIELQLRLFPSGGVGGKVVIPNPSSWAIANPIAIVEWGIGGTSARAEADFLNGLCLNLVASWLRIRAFIDSPGPVPFVSSAFYQLSAFVGPGYPRSNNAQRTMAITEIIVIPGTESAVYTVPRYAKQVSFNGANLAHDPFTGDIRFYRSGDGPVAASFICDYSFTGSNPGPFPVPNGAYFFTVVPGIAEAAMQAVFDLGI